ncbi:MAG: hypothetical protein MK135_14725, partial [Polyangiaceae bacterium]|nr:hypothetical protein [Polyangiaceae bacterium]
DQVEDPPQPFSFELRIDNAGRDEQGNSCGFGLGYERNVPLENGAFEFEFNPNPNAPTFTISGQLSGNTATGSARSAYAPFTCGLEWTATKVAGGGVPAPDPDAGTGGGSSESTGITPGLWEGQDVCLFVDATGQFLVPSSRCDLDTPDDDPWLFDWQPSALSCGISFPQDDEPQSLQIDSDGRFSYRSQFIEFEGQFSNGTVTGSGSTRLGCQNGSTWSAQPVD